MRESIWRFLLVIPLAVGLGPLWPAPISSGVAEVHGSRGSGTNVAGSDVSLSGGEGTGTGAGGSVLIRTASAGATGATLNPLVTRVTVDSTGLVTLADGLSVGTTAQTASAGRFQFRQAAVRARNTGVQTLTTGVYTAVAFNAADAFDTDALHDPAANNTRLTASVAGNWLVAGGAQIAADPTTFALQIRRNGVDEYAVNTPDWGGAGGMVTALVDLAAGGYVELLVFQDSGVGVNVQTGTRTFFSMVYVGE